MEIYELHSANVAMSFFFSVPFEIYNIVSLPFMSLDTSVLCQYASAVLLKAALL